MSIDVAAGGFSFRVSSVGGVWSWTVQANNVSGLGQLYQVVDVLTPYGRLTDAAVPLPGDVVTAMADSVSQLKQQLAPAVSLLSGSPSSYSITVTEGGSTTSVSSVPFVNSGAFGSYLTVAASVDSPWLSASPVRSGPIGKNQQAQVSISVLPSLMTATGSPYTGHVSIQDASNPNSEVVVTVVVTVIPRAAIVVGPTIVSLTYSLSTATSNGAQQATVTNGGPGGSFLDFVVAKVQNQSLWLAFSPLSGGPLASGDSDIVTFSLLNSNIPTIPGTYSEVVSVRSSAASNSPQDITVQLTVTP